MIWFVYPLDESSHRPQPASQGEGGYYPNPRNRAYDCFLLTSTATAQLEFADTQGACPERTAKGGKSKGQL